MACKPGELALFTFPFSDLQSTKKRPVMVLTSPDRHADFIGFAITTVEHHDHALQVERQEVAAVFRALLLEGEFGDLGVGERRRQIMQQPQPRDVGNRLDVESQERDHAGNTPVDR